MKIEIEPRLAEALRAAVAAGEFNSVDEAVAVALERMLVEADDFSWAKVLVDEARNELERGEGIPVEQARALLRDRLARSSD